MDQVQKMYKATLTQIYGENINKEYKLTGSEVLIGRSPKCHINLMSPNISRRHCILTYTENGWRIKDNKSQNGTYINGRKLKLNENHPLQRADIVFLGPPSEMPQGFSYEEFMQFEENVESDEDVVVQLTAKRACEENIGISPSKISKKVKSLESDTSKKRTGCSTDSTMSRPRYKVRQKFTNGKNKKKIDANPVSKGINISSAYDSDQDSESLVSSKGADTGSQIYEISSTGNDHDENSESLISVAKDAESCVFSDYSPEGHWELDTETYKSNSQSPAKEKELESKLFLLSEQIKLLQESKLELLKNYNDVCEKNKVLDQQLADKEKKLEDDFKKYEVKAKNEVKSELLEKFEEDLVCNICTELFIKPTVLDCSHTFCEYCIKEWKKKKNDCPICRCKIKNVTRVRTLEEFIDKTLANLTPDQRVKRDTVIAERFRLEHPPQSDRERTPRRRRNGRRQHRNARNSNTSVGSTSIEIIEESSYERPHSQTRIINIPSDPLHYQITPMLSFFFS